MQHMPTDRVLISFIEGFKSCHAGCPATERVGNTVDNCVCGNAWIAHRDVVYRFQREMSVQRGLCVRGVTIDSTKRAHEAEHCMDDQMLMTALQRRRPELFLVVGEGWNGVTQFHTPGPVKAPQYSTNTTDSEAALQGGCVFNSEDYVSGNCRMYNA